MSACMLINMVTIWACSRIFVTLQRTTDITNIECHIPQLAREHALKVKYGGIISLLNVIFCLRVFDCNGKHRLYMCDHLATYGRIH